MRRSCLPGGRRERKAVDDDVLNTMWTGVDQSCSRCVVFIDLRAGFDS